VIHLLPMFMVLETSCVSLLLMMNCGIVDAFPNSKHVTELASGQNKPDRVDSMPQTVLRTGRFSARPGADAINLMPSLASSLMSAVGVATNRQVYFENRLTPNDIDNLSIDSAGIYRDPFFR
jgi:hypothetical protein